MIKFTIDKVFFLLLVLTPIIDSINGYFMQVTKLGSVIGPIYRLILYVFMLACFFYKNSFNKIFKLGIVIIYFIFIGFIFSFNDSKDAIFYNLNNIIKLFFPILIIEAYRNLNIKEIIKKDTISKIFKYYSVIFPMTIIPFTLIGKSLSVYSNGAGAKGFYKANNELNIILVTLLIYNFNNLFYKKNKLKNGLLTLLNFCCLFLIGSKTTIIALLIIIIAYLFINLKKFKVLNNILLGVIVVLVIYIVNKVYYDQIYLAFQRQIYFYNLYEDNLSSYILSSRNILLGYAIDSLKSSNNFILNFIIGFSPYDISQEIGFNIGRANRIIEMDFFDLFFSYGLVGIAFIYTYYLSVIKKSIRKIKNSKLEYSYLIGYIFIMGFSTFAGHVLFSAMASTIFALICCGMISIEHESIIKNT